MQYITQSTTYGIPDLHIYKNDKQALTGRFSINLEGKVLQLFCCLLYLWDYINLILSL